MSELSENQDKSDKPKPRRLDVYVILQLVPVFILSVRYFVFSKGLSLENPKELLVACLTYSTFVTTFYFRDKTKSYLHSFLMGIGIAPIACLVNGIIFATFIFAGCVCGSGGGRISP